MGDADPLADAKRARSTTPDDERRHCPDCGSINISTKVPRPEGRREHDEAFRCVACGEHFDAGGGRDGE